MMSKLPDAKMKCKFEMNSKANLIMYSLFHNTEFLITLLRSYSFHVSVLLEVGRKNKDQ